MSTFTGWGRTNDIDFGDYVHYPHGMSHEPHIYKVIGAFESNTYRKPPDWAHSVEENHGDVVPVLNIIHCGIDETEVIRVREDDCKKIEEEF